MKKKLLVITWVPIYKWDYIRYGFDKLSKKYSLIIFDLSCFLFKEFKVKELYKKKDKIKCIEFHDLNEIIKAIKKTHVDLIINLTGISQKHPIYQKLLEKKVNIISFIDFKLSNYFYFPKNIILYLKFFLKIFLNFHKKNSNDFAIVAGDNLLNRLNSIGKNIIYSHSINYDLAIKKKYNKNGKKNRKIACYIDSGFGFHPDFKLSRGINKKFNVNTFANKLNIFFKKLNLIGYDVYFLAYPKIPKKNQRIYKNCKIIYYKTLEYIKNSDLVITTSSSTIEYAIIFKKKILKIFTKEIKSYPKNMDEYNGFKNFFSKNVINLDLKYKNEEIKKKIILPNKKYLEYISKFVKHPKSNNTSFSKIIKKLIN